MSIAVIIARFQTPYLHEGHTSLIDSVKEAHAKMIVVLGVSPVPGAKRNPYDYATRERMLKGLYPDIMVLPLADRPDDAEWSLSLDQLLKYSFPGESFTLYGSRDSFIPSYQGENPTQELPEQVAISATEIRERYANKIFDSEDFRAGILYALTQQPNRTYATVDIAIFRNERQELLLGQKQNEKGWRLIGGFADPTDENLEVAAKREAMEEIGPMELANWQYETSQLVDDWRYRDGNEKIMTTLFSCDVIYGAPHAQDDLDAANWFTHNELSGLIERREIVPEHIPLLNYLITRTNNPSPQTI